MKKDLNKAELMLKENQEKMWDQERVKERKENQATDEISSYSSNLCVSDQQNFSLLHSSFHRNLKADSPTTPDFKQRRNTNDGIQKFIGLEFSVPNLEDDKLSQRS